MNSQHPQNLTEKELAAVARLKTIDECAQFAANMASNEKLVQAAARRSVEIQVATHSNEADVVRDIWAVLYSYEEVLFLKHGKRLRAAYTRRSIDNHGAVGAVELIVCQREKDDDGFARLSAAGLSDKTFEAIVLKHPQHFSAAAIEHAKFKLDSHG